ncbi:MAG: hypothetical protein V4739_04675 [Pseudomonadota bacterium]
MTALLIFAAAFGNVFALGLQSLNVNGRHMAMAFVTSFGIGTMNLVLLKVMPGPTSAFEIAAFLAGGPLGIVASMYAHPHIVRLMQRRSPDFAKTKFCAPPHSNRRRSDTQPKPPSPPRRPQPWQDWHEL